MIPELSIVLPAIRTYRWQKLYDSAKLACKNYSWEIIFCGPFSPPTTLKQEDNCYFIRDYGSPSRATQKASLIANGEFLFFTVDDCILNKDSLDNAISLLLQHNYKNSIINCRYTENGDHMDEKYWLAGTSIKLPYVNPNWKISLQPLIHKNLFYNLGGLDCMFEYSNHAFHDLMFRAQKQSINIYNSLTEICLADWYEGTSGDHAPIHYAQLNHDETIFNLLYSQPDIRTKIELNNWLLSPEIWVRRFNAQLPNSYEEMYPNLVK